MATSRSDLLCSRLRAEEAPGDGETWGGCRRLSAAGLRTMKQSMARARRARCAHGALVAGARAVVSRLLAVEDAATEGKKVVTAMLIVGLTFIAVIAIGETTHALRHRRRSRH